MKSLSEVRHQLVEARHDLRTTKDAMEVVEAQAQTRVIAAAAATGGLGKNDTERKPALIERMASDPAYRAALAALRECERHVEHLEADLKDAEDRRSDDHWRIRMEMIEALRGAGPTDVRDDAGDTSIFDEAIQQAADVRVVEEAEALVAASSGYEPHKPGDPDFFDGLPF